LVITEKSCNFVVSKDKIKVVRGGVKHAKLLPNDFFIASRFLDFAHFVCFARNDGRVGESEKKNEERLCRSSFFSPSLQSIRHSERNAVK